MSKRISPQTGLLLAGVGAAGVLGSLWLPWYTIRLPQAFRDLFSKLGGGATPSSSSSPSDQIASGFGAMMKGLAAAIPDEITGTGWQTMNSADWVLAVVSGLALLAAVAIGGGLSGIKADAGQTGRFIAFAGAVCAAIAVYHVVRHPGAGGAGASLPGLDSAITVRYGAYVAGLGGLLMLAGGLFASSGRSAPAFAADAGAPAAPVYTPPAPYTPPAMPDPFAAPDPAPAPMPAADPFGGGVAPAPVMSTPMAPPEPPSGMPAADPFAVPAAPATPPMTPPPPSAPREPGSSIGPPGFGA